MQNRQRTLQREGARASGILPAPGFLRFNCLSVQSLPLLLSKLCGRYVHNQPAGWREENASSSFRTRPAGRRLRFSFAPLLESSSRGDRSMLAVGVRSVTNLSGGALPAERLETKGVAGRISRVLLGRWEAIAPTAFRRIFIYDGGFYEVTAYK
jgi:hypothetical protein